MRNRLFHAPEFFAQPSAGDTVADVLSGIAIMFFVIGACLFLGGMAG